MRNFISLKPCPMCGGDVRRQGKGINVVFEAEPLVCSSCGFWIDLSYYKTWREAIEDWNEQPYIDGLKLRIFELLVAMQDIRDLARTGLKPDCYDTEERWLRHKVNEISWLSNHEVEKGA